MECLNCGNYATKFYVSDDGAPCFLCPSCADAWELGHWYGQHHPECTLDKVDNYDRIEDSVLAQPYDSRLDDSEGSLAVI